MLHPSPAGALGSAIWVWEMLPARPRSSSPAQLLGTVSTLPGSPEPPSVSLGLHPPPGSNLVSRPTATASSLSGCRGNCVGQSSCSGSDAGERELTADPEAANGDAETE